MKSVYRARIFSHITYSHTYSQNRGFTLTDPEIEVERQTKTVFTSSLNEKCFMMSEEGNVAFLSSENTET